MHARGAQKQQTRCRIPLGLRPFRNLDSGADLNPVDNKTKRRIVIFGLGSSKNAEYLGL